MPIDFATVAARYQAQFAAQTKITKPLFERLADAIKILDRNSIEAERATRAYPVLRYRDEALCVTVDAGLMPPLPAPASLGFVDGLAKGGEQFLAQMGWVETAVRQETALLHLLSPLLGMAQSVLASMERFDRPRPEMFDPGRARFSDLFGVANLGWSSLLGSANQADLRATAQGLADSRPVVSTLGGLFSAAFPDPAELGELDPVSKLVEKLDEKTKLFFDIVLFLPVAGLGLDVLVRDGVLLAKFEILERLAGIEAEVFGLRRQIVTELLHVTAFGSLIQAGLDVAETWARLNSWIVSYELPRFVGELLDGLTELLAGVTAWGRWITDLLELFRAIATAILDYDLMPAIMGALLPPWALALLPPLPRLTIDDLVSMMIAGGASIVRSTLDKWLAGAEAVLDMTPFAGSYAAKVRDLRVVLGTVLTATPFRYDPDVMPTGPLAPFPDVFDEVFGGGRQALFVASIDSLGREIRVAMGEVLGGMIGLTSGLSATASSELDRMSRHGTGTDLARFGRTSTAMAAGVFGPERAELLARQRPPSGLAAAFDEVMAGGGIALAAAMIPAYIGSIRRFWATRNRTTAHPTSAHILARHGRLAAVRVPRMTIAAPGHDPTDALAEAVAARMRTGVTTAFRDGRDRFAQLAAAPTGGGGRGG